MVNNFIGNGAKFDMCCNAGIFESQFSGNAQAGGGIPLTVTGQQGIHVDATANRPGAGSPNVMIEGDTQGGTFTFYMERGPGGAASNAAPFIHIATGANAVTISGGQANGGCDGKMSRLVRRSR